MYNVITRTYFTIDLKSNLKYMDQFAEIKVFDSEIRIVRYTDYINNKCICMCGFCPYVLVSFLFFILGRICLVT